VDKESLTTIHPYVKSEDNTIALGPFHTLKALPDEINSLNSPVQRSCDYSTTTSSTRTTCTAIYRYSVNDYISHGCISCVGCLRPILYSFYEAWGASHEGLILVLVPVSANCIVWILSNSFILHSSYITHLNNIVPTVSVPAALLARRMQSAVETLEY
jgi:hypothetical protein